jgi:MFS family permease
MSSTKNQFYATFCVNLVCLGYGLSTGWTSVAIPLLQSAESPLKNGPISNEDSSLIGSILTIGGLFGALSFGYISNVIGRKITIFLIAFPQIIGWILMYFAESAMTLILFRFLAGFSGGAIFTVIPVYTSEISENR